MGKTRKKPPVERSIRLVRSPAEDGIAVVCISTPTDSTHYTVREIPCEIGGRGFEVHKTGFGTLYHVRVGTPEECSCECKGFLRWDYCRHVMGLLALVEAGRL